MAAKQAAIADDPLSAETNSRTSIPTPTDVTARAPGVTPGEPAWTRRSCVRSAQPSRRPARRGPGVQHDHHTQNSPAPSSRPTTTPMAGSALAAQQRRQVDPGHGEPIGVRRVSLAAHQVATRDV